MLLISVLFLVCLVCLQLAPQYIVELIFFFNSAQISALRLILSQSKEFHHFPCCKSPQPL